jgi:glycosyltransferase involved in cell wall biosynthesis
VFEKMKILMVTPRFSPKSGGGGFVVTDTLCKALVKRGHTVEVWTSDYQLDKEFVLKEYMNNPSICPFPAAVTLMGFHVTPLLCKLAKLAFKQKNYMWESKNGKHIGYKQFDIIHLHGCRTFQSVVVAYYASKYKIPYIIDSHGFPIQGKWLQKLILKTFDYLFANRVVRNATLCIAQTDVNLEEYLRAGAKKDRVRVFPAPYDLSIFDDLPKRGKWRNRQNVGSKALVVGFLGGLERIKGLDFLTKTFANVCQRKDAYLVLAGTDMGFRKELEVLIDKLGIGSKVIFTGYINGNDKLEYLVDCDVCVFPSRAESGFPFAALEATMCGVPVIVTDGIGAAEDVRKMGCGCIVKFGDGKALAEAIQIAIDSGLNVEKGKEYIRKYRSIAESVKKYEEVYREATT